MDQNDFALWAQETVNIRKNVLKMIHQAQSGHSGGSLSLIEIVYALFAKGGVLKHYPQNTNKIEKDRFIISKGHGCPGLYAILSAVGYDITEKELMTLRNIGSRLQGHPDRVRIPYIEASTGSLGQGASIALGMALSYKMDQLDNRIFCLLGDGEMQEGQIWEVALSAPFKKLNNLTLILDYNKGQIDGLTKDVLDLEPLKEKWIAFGWDVHEINGHKYDELVPALKSKHHQKPTMIIAHTIKGKGVSYMEENTVGWHGRAPNDEELAQAISELDKNLQIGI